MEPPALLHSVRLLEEMRKVSEIYEPLCPDLTYDLSDVSVSDIASLKAVAALEASPALSETNFMSSNNPSMASAPSSTTLSMDKVRFYARSYLESTAYQYPPQPTHLQLSQI